MAWWMRPRDVPPKVGIRLFDLHDGNILGEALLPVFASLTLSLSPDGKQIAFLIGDGKAVQLREFPKGTTDTILARPPDPAGLEPLGKIIADHLYFSPDGNALINLRSEANRADIYLWDLRNPSASRHLKRVDSAVLDIAFRTDSKMLAFRSGSRRIVLADLSAEGKVAEVEVPLDIAAGDPLRSAPPTIVLWSPNEPLLAIASVGATGKGTILVWDTALAQERGRWEGDFNPDNILLAFSPDGKRLACGGGLGDGTIRCFHLDDRRETLRIDGAHLDGVSCLRWESNDHLLSAGMLNTFRSWACSNAPLRSSMPITGEQVGQLTYSPDGRWLAFREEDKQARVVVVDAASANVRHRFELPVTNRTGRLRFRADGNVLAWVTPEGDTVAWDLLRNGKEMARSQGDDDRDDPWFAPVFTEDGRLVTPTAIKDRLVLHDLISGDHMPLGADFVVGPLAELGIRKLLVTSGHRLIGLPSDNDLLQQPIPLWDGKTGRREGELTPEKDEVSGLIRAAASPDGRRLLKICIPASFNASVGSSEPVLSVWNLDTHERMWHVRRNVLISSWAISNDSRLLAIGYRNGYVELWDVEKGEELFRWQPRGNQEVKSLVFSADGTHLASSDGKAPIHILNLVELRKELARMGLDWN
jgi:WD40 repeat protein